MDEKKKTFPRDLEKEPVLVVTSLYYGFYHYHRHHQQHHKRRACNIFFGTLNL